MTDKECVLHITNEISLGKLESQSQQYYRKHILSIWADFKKNLSKNHKCFWKGCNSINTISAHTISNANCIQGLADDTNHIRTPAYHIFDPEIKIKIIGINKSSVFQGFCETHDNLFQNIDSVHDVPTEDLAKFQPYRSLCKEIFDYEHYLQYSEKTNRHWKELINNEANIKLQEYRRLNNSDSVNYIQFFDDSHLYPEQHKASNDYLHHLNDIKDNMDRFYSGKFESQPMFRGVTLPLSLPVALSGWTQYQFDDSNSILFSLNVIPYEEKTFVFITSYNEEAERFKAVVNECFKNPVHTIEFIEHFMIRGTDNWFLSPRHWNQMTDEEKVDLQKSMHFSPHFIYHKKEIDLFKMEKKILNNASFIMPT
ncbi:MAG: hypothetical protein OCD01_09935 [Fibrobacterales bacterium]